jgi:hypothetical protein
MFWKRLLAPLKRRAAEARAEQGRLDAVRDEYDRLRAELSHLEREIYELWESDLPRSQKTILESAIKVRIRSVEDRMSDLSYRLWSGVPPEIG